MRNFVVLFYILLSSHTILSYPWPVSPFNTQHPINATLGEWREGVRFHRGVDICRGVGTPVYPVVSGVIEEISASNIENGFVKVRGDNGIVYDYIHIRRNEDIQLNDEVIEGQTQLGVIGNLPHPHLHFEEDDGNLNPLRAGGLTPYTDNHPPEIKAGSIRFLPQGINEPPFGPIDYPIIYGKTDVRADATDRRTASDGSAADLSI